jgi:hypothetical protein
LLFKSNELFSNKLNPLCASKKNNEIKKVNQLTLFLSDLLQLKIGQYVEKRNIPELVPNRATAIIVFILFWLSNFVF